MSSLVLTCPAPKGQYPSTPSWRGDRPRMCPWFRHHRWRPVPGQAGQQNAPGQLMHCYWLMTNSAILGWFFVFGPPIAPGKTSRLSAMGDVLTQLRRSQEFELDRETKDISIYCAQCIGFMKKEHNQEQSLFIQEVCQGLLSPRHCARCQYSSE